MHHRHEPSSPGPEPRTGPLGGGSPPRSALAGFTLLEMLAAVLIMTVLVVLLFGAFHQGQNGWVSAQTRAEVYQEGRALLETIAQEIELAFTNGITRTTGAGSTIWAFVAPVSLSDEWSTDGTNDIVELCWVQYRFSPGPASSPVGALYRTRKQPSLQGSTVLPFTLKYGGDWGGEVLLSSNVVSFKIVTNRPVRIRLEMLDPVTARQLSANLSLTNRARVLETAVYLATAP